MARKETNVDIQLSKTSGVQPKIRAKTAVLWIHSGFPLDIARRHSMILFKRSSGSLSKLLTEGLQGTPLSCP